MFNHLSTRRRQADPAGFTLIELLLSIAIIGILAMVILTAINPAQRIKEAKDTQARADLASIRNSLEAYATANGGNYPTTSGWYCENCSAVWAPTATGVNMWIPELVAKGYIKRLPTSPNNLTGRCGTGTAYIYQSDGTDYKVIAHCVPDTGLNSGGAQPTSPYCNGGTFVSNNPDGNPQHVLKSMVDPMRYSIAVGTNASYAVYTAGAACW